MQYVWVRKSITITHIHRPPRPLFFSPTRHKHLSYIHRYTHAHIHSTKTKSGLSVFCGVLRDRCEKTLGNTCIIIIVIVVVVGRWTNIPRFFSPPRRWRCWGRDGSGIAGLLHSPSHLASGVVRRCALEHVHLRLPRDRLEDEVR